MLAIKPTPFISPPLPQAVPTDVDTESPVTRDYGREDKLREEWQRLIDDQLINWGWDPGQIEDDDAPAPSRDTVQLAIQVANKLCRGGIPAPTRIVPDAHGGIVFEWEAGDVFESIRISADGSVEYCAFENCRIVQRHSGALQTIDSE